MNIKEDVIMSFVFILLSALISVFGANSSAGESGESQSAIEPNIEFAFNDINQSTEYRDNGVDSNVDNYPMGNSISNSDGDNSDGDSNSDSNSDSTDSAFATKNVQFGEQRVPANLNGQHQNYESSPEAKETGERRLATQSSFGANPVLPAYVQYYQKRYPLTDTFTKLIDNHGNGFNELYGVRNFRAVLNGVLYRGGANNVYNKNKVRDNRNPLPPEGLANLCKEGFRNVFYMYTTNFDKKTNPVICKTERGPDNKLEIKMSYLQKGPWDRKTQYEILRAVFDNIVNPNAGPIYMHCWNGWHASGLISSIALKQYCNYNGEQAVKYWDMNTDGNNKGKSYESFRSQVRSFVPFDDLKIPAEIKKQICLAPPATGA
jgi:hypothetical protein